MFEMKLSRLNFFFRNVDTLTYIKNNKRSRNNEQSPQNLKLIKGINFNRYNNDFIIPSTVANGI